MSITTLEGPMGSGKTLSAVALCYMEHTAGRKIVSNVDMTFPHDKFDPQFLIEHMLDTQLEDCVILLDESYIYLDSRSSTTKLNKLFTYFIAQTRKRGVDMFICIHHIDTVDKRLRRALEVRGTCRFRKEIPCTRCKGLKEYKGYPCERCCGYGEGGWATVTFYNLHTTKKVRVRIHGPKFWGLYSTKERIAVTGKQITIDPEDL